MATLQQSYLEKSNVDLAKKFRELARSDRALAVYSRAAEIARQTSARMGHRWESWSE